MLDKKPDEPRETIDLRASKEVRQAATPETSLHDRLQAAAAGVSALQTPQRDEARAAAGGATGAALAAGVLTAVDEDEEDAEDAPVPDEFGYDTDNMEED